MEKQIIKRNYYLPPYIAICVMGILCFAPMIAIVLISEQTHSNLFNTVALLLLSALFVCLLAAVGGRKFAPWLGAIYQILLPVELASIIIVKSPISFGLMQAIFQTNISEASELAGMFILVGIITLFTWAIYLWSWFSWNIGNKSIPKWFRCGVLVVLIFCSLSIFVKMFLISDIP